MAGDRNRELSQQPTAVAFLCKRRRLPVTAEPDKIEYLAEFARHEPRDGWIVHQVRKTCSREEYLALDDGADIKHEYFQGEIFAMAGGTFNHAAISLNIVTALANKLRGKPCRPMNSDMRVHSPADLDTYPDVSVFCGKPRLMDDRRTLLNPAVIVEVLSRTTRTYDRGDKFTLYRSIDSLRDYVLVDSEQIFVEHFRRTDSNEWILHEYRDASEIVPLPSIGVSMPLGEIYEDIEFDG